MNEHIKKSLLTSNLKKDRVLIFGGGGHAKMCIDILRQMDIYEIAGIVDEKLELGSEILGVPVIGRDKDLVDYYNKGIHKIINGVGAATNHAIRGKIYKMLKGIGFILPNLIHPKSSIEPSVVLGEGNQIMSNAVIGSAVKVQNNCIINSGAVVSHDSVIEDNVHISPGAILAGNVYVKENTLIGMGSTVYLNLVIGNNVIIYNGCNVMKDVPDNSRVVAT